MSLMSKFTEYEIVMESSSDVFDIENHCHLSAVDVEALLEEVELPAGGLLALGQGPD